MKHLAIIGFALLTFSASAQKANFKSSNAKHEAGIHTQFNFTLTEVNSQAQIQELAAKMKASPGVLKLDVLNPTAGSANLIIITDQKNDVLTVQNDFSAAGIKQVTYDDKKVKAANLKKVFTAEK